MKAKTKEEAAINVANELLARWAEPDAIGDYDMDVLESVLMLAVVGKRCYTGIVAQVIGVLVELERKHEEAREENASWVYWNDAKIEKRARALKAKAIKIGTQYGMKE